MVLHTNTLKNNLISGTLLLTLTGFLSRIIGFYYKIFLSRTIGAEGLGIYQLIFPVFALIIAVSAAGIQTSISRYCAQCQTEQQSKRYLVTGLVLSLLISGICIVIGTDICPLDRFCFIRRCPYHISASPDDVFSAICLYSFLHQWLLFRKKESCNSFCFTASGTVDPCDRCLPAYSDPDGTGQSAVS